MSSSLYLSAPAKKPLGGTTTVDRARALVPFYADVLDMITNADWAAGRSLVLSRAHASRRSAHHGCLPAGWTPCPHQPHLDIQADAIKTAEAGALALDAQPHGRGRPLVG
jgi:hypothetical protein